MEENLSVFSRLDSEVQWDEIERISSLIFKEGDLSKIDELIVLLIPTLNIVYYNYIAKLDDREYAKDDLIQSALTKLYEDIKLRWDKYIHVDVYSRYFMKIAKTLMLNLVYVQHSRYSLDEFDPESRINSMNDSDEVYRSIENSIVEETFPEDMLALTTKLASYRKSQYPILNAIIRTVYVKKKPINAVINKLKVLGVSKEEILFLNAHVEYLHKLSYNYLKSMIKENSKMKVRIEEIFDRFESPTYEILSEHYRDSIIPEIYAEFGPDFTKNFVRNFSGKTVKVPEYQDFCDDLLGPTVLELSKGEKKNLYRLSVDYKLPYTALVRIFNRVSKFIKK